MVVNERAQAILDFWFSPVGSGEHGKTRGGWFRKNVEFDGLIRSQFVADIEAALAGELADWEQSSQELLALIILLDQFTRNIFRDSARAFAGDVRALALARKAIELQWDTALLPVQRWFAYLPFEHSENLADQEEAVRLFRLLEAYPECNGVSVWAEKHYEVIAKFGRFPHRNAVLGRASTAEELEYLAQPGAGF